MCVCNWREIFLGDWLMAIKYGRQVQLLVLPALFTLCQSSLILVYALNNTFLMHFSMTSSSNFKTHQSLVVIAFPSKC